MDLGQLFGWLLAALAALGLAWAFAETERRLAAWVSLALISAAAFGYGMGAGDASREAAQHRAEITTEQCYPKFSPDVMENIAANERARIACAEMFAAWHKSAPAGTERNWLIFPALLLAVGSVVAGLLDGVRLAAKFYGRAAPAAADGAQQLGVDQHAAQREGDQQQ